jgi:hypothetical protein
MMVGSGRNAGQSFKYCACNFASAARILKASAWLLNLITMKLLMSSWSMSSAQPNAGLSSYANRGVLEREYRDPEQGEDEDADGEEK